MLLTTNNHLTVLIPLNVLFQFSAVWASWFFFLHVTTFIFYCLNNKFFHIFPLMQKGECNLNKPYHSVLNVSSLSVLMLPYHVYLLYLIMRRRCVNFSPVQRRHCQLFYKSTLWMSWCFHVMLMIFIYSIKLFESACFLRRLPGSHTGGEVMVLLMLISLWDTGRTDQCNLQILIKHPILQQTCVCVTCFSDDGCANIWGVMNNKCLSVNTSNCPAGEAEGKGGALKKKKLQMNDLKKHLQLYSHVQSRQ